VNTRIALNRNEVIDAVEKALKFCFDEKEKTAKKWMEKTRHLYFNFRKFKFEFIKPIEYEISSDGQYILIIFENPKYDVEIEDNYYIWTINDLQILLKALNNSVENVCFIDLKLFNKFSRFMMK
jgi:hypothetical protein